MNSGEHNSTPRKRNPCTSCSFKSSLYILRRNKTLANNETVRQRRGQEERVGEVEKKGRQWWGERMGGRAGRGRDGIFRSNKPWLTRRQKDREKERKRESEKQEEGEEEKGWMEKGKEEKDSKIMALNQESLHFGHCNATSSSTNMLDYMHRYHGMHASHGTQDSLMFALI